MPVPGLTFRLVLRWSVPGVAACVGVGLAARCQADSPHNLTAPVPTPMASPVVELVRQLGDQSFARREDASLKLTNFGDLIRPALIDAARHAPDPEVRARAARLLCLRAWARPDDPPAVQQILSDYRTVDVDKRIAAVGRLGTTRDGNGVAVGYGAMVRLLTEEPSDDVRWAIVEQLRGAAETPRDPLRKLQPEPDDAPALAAVGWSWANAAPNGVVGDLAKAVSLLRRAADVALDHPADDRGEVDAILQFLLPVALSKGDFDDAIELTRRHLWAGDEPVQQEVLGLFAMYAQYGPRRGFERDLRTFEAFFDQPEMMYTIGRLHARQGDAVLAEACYRSAAAASVGDPEAHARVGEFLLGRQWFDLARGEFTAALSQDAAGGGAASQELAANFGLAKCAAGVGDNPTAATYYTRALTSIKRYAAQNPSANNEQFARQLAGQAEWHRLRDAMDHNNRDEVAARVNDMLAPAGGVRTDDDESLDVNIDLVRALKSLGRRDEAKARFDLVFARPRALFDSAPRDPQVLNNLAWLCARCDEHADDAYRWALEAVRLAPGSAAYLDTAGEAAAHLGKWDDAVRLEAQALSLQPGDVFMAAQLAKFQAEVAKRQH